ncbi:SpoIIE family protein phosphatase [Streptomyces sp. PTD5-9]|uniref:SpoIIE family protein phosphatase n=1 Tax=Streptomyces sp. PTD5-9 TaxID=3120150 RepID=UPI00300B8283
MTHEATVTAPPLTSGVPLGLAELAAGPATVDRFAFPPGATPLLTTDGLTEARAADGTFYPLDERLTKRVHLSPTDLPRALYDDARAYAGGGRPARRRGGPVRPAVTAPLSAARRTPRNRPPRPRHPPHSARQVRVACASVPPGAPARPVGQRTRHCAVPCHMLHSRAVRPVREARGVHVVDQADVRRAGRPPLCAHGLTARPVLPHQDRTPP